MRQIDLLGWSQSIGLIGLARLIGLMRRMGVHQVIRFIAVSCHPVFHENLTFPKT
jgi:hypothetical protein